MYTTQERQKNAHCLPVIENTSSKIPENHFISFPGCAGFLSREMNGVRIARSCRLSALRLSGSVLGSFVSRISPGAFIADILLFCCVLRLFAECFVGWCSLALLHCCPSFRRIALVVSPLHRVHIANACVHFKQIEIGWLRRPFHTQYSLRPKRTQIIFQFPCALRSVLIEKSCVFFGRYQFHIYSVYICVWSTHAVFITCPFWNSISFN